MAPKSNFSRIVIVKSLAGDCPPVLKWCIGRYTHIQSFNGVLLDGLDMSEAAEIVKTAFKDSHVQLMVRYVHPIQSDSADQGLLAPVHVKPDTTVPIPLFILGDFHMLCKELFEYLRTTEKELLKPMSTAMTDIESTLSMDGESSIAAFAPSLATANTGNTGYTYDSGYRSSCYSSSPVDSNKYITRALLRSSKLSTPTTLSPTSQLSTNTMTDRCFVLNMFTPDVGRSLVHLFLRQSGIYLIAINLKDMVENPIVQFENLLFWLRLLETFVRPDDLTRVIIVGMGDGHVKSLKEECLSDLEGAIQEAGFKQVYSEDGSFVVTFDRNQPDFSLDHLYLSISGCVDSWRTHKQFCKKVFLPFEWQLLSRIEKFQAFSVLMPLETLLSTVKSTRADIDPVVETLAAYSSALISQKIDSLLQPGYLIDLLRKLYRPDYLYSHNIVLPVVTSRFLNSQILATHPNFTNQQVASIIQWAEDFKLFYSLGYSNQHEIYFIPLLATEFFIEDGCYDWPFTDDDKPWFNKPNVTTLYAKLNFAAVHHFFYAVLTEILKDIVAGVQNNPRQTCHIKDGCMEAIMPINMPEGNTSILVYLKYHLLQNVIEFRAKSSTKDHHLYQAADSKLYSAFTNNSKNDSQNSQMAYSNAVTFYIPSAFHDPTIVTSMTGKLFGLSPSSSSNQVGVALLKTKQATIQNWKWTLAMEGMKKAIPEVLIVQWGHKLSIDAIRCTLVGYKLNVLTKGDVEFYQQHPHPLGNGGLVLSRWVHSQLTYKDLTFALRSSDVGMNDLADEIEEYFDLELKMQRVEAFSVDPQLEFHAEYPGIIFSDTSIVTHITSCGADIDYLEEMGISVSIPEGAIGTKEAQLELIIKPCFTGIFKLPEGYESASPAYLIHHSKKAEFQKDVTIQLQHHAYLRSEEDCEDMVFLSASSRPMYVGSQRAYIFHETSGQWEVFAPGSQVGEISLRHFCLVKAGKRKRQRKGSASKKQKDNQHHLYSARLYRNLQRPFGQGFVSALFCTCLSHPTYMKHCNSVISREYTGMTEKGEGRSDVFAEIDGDSISIFPQNASGFKITVDKTPAQILKRDILLPELLDIDVTEFTDYPPRLLIYLDKINDDYMVAPKVDIIGLDRQCSFELAIFAAKSPSKEASSKVEPLTEDDSSGTTQLLSPSSVQPIEVDMKVHSEKEGLSVYSHQEKSDPVLAAVSTCTLTIEDLGDVLVAVEALSAKWRVFCTKLRLRQHSLDLIDCDHTGDSKTCLCTALGDWLKLNYDYKRHGKPTWGKLAEAAKGLDNVVYERIVRTHTQDT